MIFRPRVLAFVVLLLTPFSLISATLTVTEGQVVSVPIATRGTVVTFPFPVKSVMEPELFALSPIGAQNPKSFQISPKKPGSNIERMTFVLANDRRIVILANTVSNGEDDIELKYPPQSSRRNDLTPGSFLRNEIGLMLAMLRDENTANRTVVNKKAALGGYDNLEFALIREFRFDGLTGAVFTVMNTGKKALKVNHTLLQFGTPNRAILSQMDHEVLEPCSINRSSEPRGNGCMSALRVVLRGIDIGPTAPFKATAKPGYGPMVVAESNHGIP